MPRGYRCIILAAFGWLILAAAPQQNSAASHKTEPAQGVEKAAPPAPPAVSKAVEPVPPPKYYRPCEKPYNQRESDLCAQWKAADSANDAAYWAWWQFVLSAFGLAGLIYTLRLNSKATRAAVAAVEAQIATERPLVQISFLKFTRSSPEKRGEISLDIEWKVTNYGKSGCWLEALNISVEVGKRSPALPHSGNISVTSFIAGGKSIETVGKHTSYRITGKDRGTLNLAKILTVYGFIEYRDVGRRHWRTHFLFYANLDDTLNSVDYLPVPSKTHWQDGLV